MDGESREDEKAEQTNLFPVHSLVPRFENGLGGAVVCLVETPHAFCVDFQVETKQSSTL